MKTLKPGDLELAKPWYLKRVFTCSACGGEFQPEPGDQVRTWDSQMDCEDYAAIDCPTCKRSITVTKSSNR